MIDQPKPTGEHPDRVTIKEFMESQQHNETKLVEKLRTILPAAYRAQEWDMQIVRRFWIENQGKELYDDEQWDTFFQSVADAHNASISAERRRANSIEENVRMMNRLAAKPDEITLARTEIQQLREELADAEILCRELQEHLDITRNQLARAKPKTTEYAQGWDDHVLAAKSQREELEQQLSAERKAIHDANWLLSGHVDAGGGRKALLVWANGVYIDRENRIKNVAAAQQQR